jgi:hypothetical protein
MVMMDTSAVLMLVDGMVCSDQSQKAKPTKYCEDSFSFLSG